MTINIGGDTRSDDDKYCARLRRQMIAQGLIVPSQENTPGRPALSPSFVEKYRKRLIHEGFLIPRTL